MRYQWEAQLYVVSLFAVVFLPFRLLPFKWSVSDRFSDPVAYAQSAPDVYASH